MIGLALAVTIWGLSNLLMGWCSGYFGLYGLNKQTVNNQAFNFVGVVFAIIAIGVLIFVRPVSVGDPSDKNEKAKLMSKDPELFNKATELTRSIDGEAQGTITNESSYDDDEPKTFWAKIPQPWSHVIGISGALLAGLFFGNSFNPPQWLIDNDENASNENMDYVFAFFFGIWLTSTTYFMIYCAIMKNSPKIYPKIILPALIAGLLWGAAEISWFVANQNLSFVVSFPLITTAPGIISALWAIFLFKEIRGIKNFAFLGCGFLATILCGVFIALSRS